MINLGNSPFIRWGVRLAVAAGAAVTCIPASTAQAEMPEFRALDSYVETQMQALNLPGLALGIVHNDQIAHLKGYGIADPSGRPVTPQTPFRLASVSKTLTALAVMQLAEDGRIDLDTPVQHYLSWFRLSDEDASSRITVRHLLYHTSGVPPTTGYDNFYNGDESDTALEKNVRRLSTIQPNRPVGLTYEYANLNYDILGLLVQTVSGQTYDAYIQNHIFTPLAMHQSFTSQAEAQAHGMAVGYRRWFGLPFPANLPDDRATRPSSFLISSAEDMTHFLIAELNGGRYQDAQILSSESIAETQMPATPIRDTGWYSGMGLEVGEMSGVSVAAKTGGTANYYARILLLPDPGWGLILLANTFDIGLGDQFDAAANGIGRWLVDKHPLDVAASPIGGGNAPIKFVLAVVFVLQLITVFREKIVLPPNYSRRWLLTYITRPIVQDMIVAALGLVFVPYFLNAPLNFLFYFVPDIFWLAIAVVTIPFVKDTVKALLILHYAKPFRKMQAV